MASPTERFSSRVENYVKYRPSYPQAVIDLLQTDCGLTPQSKVADIGSGTGIFTALLLKTGAQIYAVEPNKEMREAAESTLQTNENFHTIDATAEQTTLPGHGIDLITAAQAFHWFDIPPTRAEFQRILKLNAQVALIWNDRHVDTNPFLQEYERALETYGTDYSEVNHRNTQRDAPSAFFGPGGYTLKTFPNVQTFGWEGFQGRVLSSSYVPQEGHPNHQPLIEEIRRIYDKYNQNGNVSFEYTTEVYHGPLT